MNLAGKHLHRWRQKADFPQMSFCNYIYRHLVVFRQIASAFCISFIFPTQKLQPCFTLSVIVLLKTTWLWAVTWVTVKIHLSQCWAMQLKLNRTYFRCVLRYFKFPPQLIRKKEQFLSRCVSVYTVWWAFIDSGSSKETGYSLSRELENCDWWRPVCLPSSVATTPGCTAFTVTPVPVAHSIV